MYSTHDTLLRYRTLGGISVLGGSCSELKRDRRHARFMEWSSVRFAFALLPSTKGCHVRWHRRPPETAAHDADAPTGVADADQINHPAGIIIELVAQSRATRIVYLDHTHNRRSSAYPEPEGSIASDSFCRRAHVGTACRDGHIRSDAAILVRVHVAVEDRGLDIHRGGPGLEGGGLSIQIHLHGSNVGLLRCHFRRGGPDPRTPRHVRFASAVLHFKNTRERRNHYTHRGDAVRECSIGDEPRHGDTIVELP